MERDLARNPHQDASSGSGNDFRSWTCTLRFVLLAAVATFIVASFLWPRDATSAEIGSLNAAADNPSSMTDCTVKILDLLKLKDAPSLEDIKTSTQICYSLLREQGLLKDISVRALSYEQQYRANGILLWMVVCITVSGVVLAGLQLLASYRLAMLTGSALGADSQLTLARNQVALKSSITGLSIMLLSFAFFLVFVRYVYKIDEVGDASGQQAKLVVQGTIDSPKPDEKIKQKAPSSP